ncbi:unnamed protein product [Brachionus calyciflorus]|uniref:Uncharacterized protein n=1 Tax=Brachionus calyciflorus TaxID=104777 RepID=A0A813XV77_9BILA|nr:unnamed protein product [Brachionus calyciflorus]
MNFLWTILFVSFQIVFSSYTPKTDPTIADFKIWIKEHEKAYKSQEFDEKFKTFVNNHKLVEMLNQYYQGKTEFKLNKFADMTPEEFSDKVLMKPMKNVINKDPKKLFAPIANANIPTSFDWRDYGAVTPVKDQGTVGTCWAHSAAQNLEGAYKLKGNPLTNISVEQIVDCDGTSKPSTAQSDCGVFGGWPFLAFQYIQRQGGIAKESDYPYCAGTSKNCFPCPAPGYNKSLCGPAVPYCRLSDSCQAKLDPSKFIPNLKVIDWNQTSLNETDISAQLMTIGPLSVALNAQKLQFYHKGIFDPISCDPKELNHAVLMVGWGVENKKPYWTIKNSWGVHWGEKGYFRILKDKGKCGINTQVVSAILA